MKNKVGAQKGAFIKMKQENIYIYQSLSVLCYVPIIAPFKHFFTFSCIGKKFISHQFARLPLILLIIKQLTFSSLLQKVALLSQKHSLPKWFGTCMRV